jgi:hypothetical protein
MASFWARVREAGEVFAGTSAGAHSVRNQLSRRSWKVDVKDYGTVDMRVTVGDADGSGEAPAVQIEFEHEFGKGAVAMSSREVDALINVLRRGSTMIRPLERRKPRIRHLIKEEKP